MQLQTDFAADLNDMLYRSLSTGGNVLEMLGDMILKAAILGDGPLAGIFGWQGGILDGLAPLLIPGRAEGGMLYGVGGPREDRTLFWGSPGEMVMNAAATARNLPALEAMNAGATIGGARGGGISVTNNFSGTQNPAEVEAAAYRGMQAALDDYDRNTLPGSMSRVMANPWTTG